MALHSYSTSVMVAPGARMATARLPMFLLTLLTPVSAPCTTATIMALDASAAAPALFTEGTEKKRRKTHAESVHPGEGREKDKLESQSPFHRSSRQHNIFWGHTILIICT